MSFSSSDFGFFDDPFNDAIYDALGGDNGSSKKSKHQKTLPLQSLVLFKENAGQLISAAQKPFIQETPLSHVLKTHGVELIRPTLMNLDECLELYVRHQIEEKKARFITTLEKGGIHLEVQKDNTFKNYYIFALRDINTQTVIACANFHDKGKILSLAVSPKYMGKGLGSLLLAAVIKFLETNCKCKNIFLRSNNDGLSTYLKMGFTIDKNKLSNHFPSEDEWSEKNYEQKRDFIKNNINEDKYYLVLTANHDAVDNRIEALKSKQKEEKQEVIKSPKKQRWI